MQVTIVQMTAIKQLELVLEQQLVPLEQLQLEVLERFLLLELEPLVQLLLEQLRHNRLRRSQCCCHMSCSRFQQRHMSRKSHSLELERCMCCMSRSLELERCMCCKSHSLELERCMCCMNRSLVLERCMCYMSCMSALVHSMCCKKHASLALDGSVSGGSVLACSSCDGQLRRCWTTSLLPTRTKYSNVALFYPS